MLTHHAIAQRLPDLPRWVELRALLYGGGCEIFGLEVQPEGSTALPGRPELSLLLRDPDTDEIFLAGRPAETALHAAIQCNRNGGSIIAPPEQVAWIANTLPQWSHTHIILHLLQNPQRLPSVSAAAAGLLDAATLDGLAIDKELLHELQSGAQRSPLAATFVAGQPVAFCYAGATTEALWDVSIDTLPEHRRRGYAALCAAFMIEHMRAHGRQPVWAALENNPPSLRLARKLGFVPVDTLVLFEPRLETRL